MGKRIEPENSPDCSRKKNIKTKGLVDVLLPTMNSSLCVCLNKRKKKLIVLKKIMFVNNLDLNA